MDLSLASWRQQTAELYLSDADLAGFRAGRDAMFASHPQSPVGAATFDGVPYFPASSFRCVSELRPIEGPDAETSVDVDTGGEDGTVSYRRLGRVDTPWGGLTLFWIAAYGGGLFLPFRDATSGKQSYGGGRYLTDTVKGTFGRGVTLTGDTSVRLDFDYAYNPSLGIDVQNPTTYGRAYVVVTRARRTGVSCRPVCAPCRPDCSSPNPMTPERHTSWHATASPRSRTCSRPPSTART